MDGNMTQEEQRKRLAAAYRKMPPPGREALDRIVRRLAELHGTVAREGAPSQRKKAPVEGPTDRRVI
jgi:hypothetical protein